MFGKIIIIIVLLPLINIFSFSSKDSVKVDSMLNEAFELRWLDPLESILISSKAIEISKQINYLHGIAKAYSFIGVAYENLSMYDEALRNYLEGLRFSDSLKLYSEKGFAYNNIANYYLQLDQLDLAFENLNKGFLIAQGNNDSNLLAYIYRNFSNYYRMKKDFQTALDYAQKSLALREQLNDERGIITSLKEILKIYQGNKNYLNAKVTLKKLYEKIGNNPKYNLQLAKIKQTEAEILLSKKKYNEASLLFKESLNLFKSINNLDGIIRIYKSQTNLYASLGKYKEAFENIIQHNAYLDSLNNVRSFQKISLMQTQFRNKELQNELKLAFEELKQRNITLGSLFLGFIILGISVYFTHKANREKRKLLEQITNQNKILEKDNKNKQKLLSIIGHDIRNPLGSVYSISDLLINNSDTLDKEELRNYYNIIHRAIKNLLSLLENLQLWSMNKLGNLSYKMTEVNISNLVDKTLELYDSNIKEKNLKIINKTQCNKALADENMLFAILRNLINNAIKFSNKNGILKIESECSEDSVIIKVIDSGKGLAKEKIEQILSGSDFDLTASSEGESSNGLGLQVVKEFVKLHNGQLKIRSEANKETEFSFTLKKV
jgi:signal transduction histidine kinase